MDKRDKKERRILTSYRQYILPPLITIAIIILITASFILVHQLTDARWPLYALLTLAMGLFVAYVIFFFRSLKRLRITYYDQLFKTTYDNIEKIKNNESDLLSYGDSDIKEIQMLDDATRQIKEKLSSAYLIVRDSDYSKLSLEYVDKSKNLITYDSFKSNLSNIIFQSQSFRNVLIEVYYSLPHNSHIKEEDKERILNIYRETFKEHKNTLFMFENDGKSLIIYLPVIDSFSEIKERLDYAVNDSSIMIRDDRGIRLVRAQYAVVAYPYSSEEMLLGDLKYAKKQNKPFYFFLPRRYIANASQATITNTSMNLNYMSKIIAALSELDENRVNSEKNVSLLKGIFSAICAYLGIDEGGIVVYDNILEKYYSRIYSNNAKLLNGNEVSKELIDSLVKAADNDNSYYFSTRKHANYPIQRELDMFGINAGIYYVIRDFYTKNVVAVIYLFNYKKNLYLNSYLREAFLMISLRIESYYEKKLIAGYADSQNKENENILALSDMCRYEVDKDFKLISMSKNFKKMVSNVQLGDYCYKQFFGEEKPCKDCPLRNKKKKYIELKKNKYEVSLALNDQMSQTYRVLLKRVEKDKEAADLFQEDYLIYSYHSFVETIRNEYNSEARGYFVLLSVDNSNEIVERKGGEAFAFLMRSYIRRLKDSLDIDDVYFYNPTTIALHFPYLGHADVINKIEKIYPLSKEDYFKEDNHDTLHISYLPIGYPRGYAYAEDYLKRVSNFYHLPRENGSDYIYFADYDIHRSASKRKFMIDVLEQEFASHNSTSMSLQPIVRVKDGHIFGAEILLRIADTHRNIFFNAEEISRLAEEENKTALITESIINFIGSMYKEYGNNIFKINVFNRIAINIDQTYLKDDSLVGNLIKLVEENNLPKAFVSFEIPEDMIPNNKSAIKTFAKELSKYKFMFSCDRYTGSYVSINELKDLGFREVKIARDIIMNIDKDPTRYQDVADIVKKAKEVGAYISAVGVENEQQFKLLKELDSDMLVQGYYLYKPLTRSDLIAALISYEK